MYRDNSYNIKNNKTDYKIIFILIAIALIISYILFFQDIFKDPYLKMEEKMVKTATNYIMSNNITTNNEIYLDVTKLDLDINSDCSITSGVIYDGANYIPNLVCSEYKSDVVKSNKDIENFITLKGDEVMIIPKGTNYYEPGYNSNDIVSIVGNVGTEEGVYNIYYKTRNSNSLAIRKVIIIDNPAIKVLFPTMNLRGEDIVYVVEGNNYEEAGISGHDMTDGNISNNVKVEGNVNTLVPGEYILTYVLTNSLGNSNTITRKVNVISRDANLVIDYRLSPENLTNQSVTIKLSINGEYTKIIYPNGSEGTSLNYVANENGIYDFTIYDTFDRATKKSVEVSNIDKTVPEGTCTATAYYDRTDVKVNAVTNKNISSYEYLFNSSTIATVQSNSYTINKSKPTSVSVRIKDSIGNSNIISCTINDQTERKIVTNSKGKNCLEGMVCYVQHHYQDKVNYPYCSMGGDSSSCGSIGDRGCSITATTNAIANMGVKSKTGVIHNPFTVYDELYPIHENGSCNGGCSAWARMRDAIINAGLSAPKKVGYISYNTKNEIIGHLRKGYPVIVWADTGAFTGGRHYMILIAVNNKGEVFLSDSANREGTSKSTYKGKKYYVDTWISFDDLISGNVKEYLLVGPKGMF